MPRSLGFGLSKHHEACHGVWPNQPISAPPGTCSWPSKAQPVLDPACPWLPVRSWPAPRLLSRGLSPLRRQTRDEPSPDPAARDLSPGTHRPSCLTHPSRLRSLRLGGGRSGSFSGSFGRQYGGSAGRQPDRDKHLHRTKRVLNPHAPFPPGDDTLMGMLFKENPQPLKVSVGTD
ncbi:uncharacterized protein LOC143271994 [Peromyscus maniculatus bairdii]|uniref:uncharacterized protein LOC143271994 n=1 Tax=Peromyscus maniculatus bairdii TaxID=230844 RepID=UPI003FD63F47